MFLRASWGRHQTGSSFHRKFGDPCGSSIRPGCISRTIQTLGAWWPLVPGETRGEKWSTFGSVRPAAPSLDLLPKLSPSWHRRDPKRESCVRRGEPQNPAFPWFRLRRVPAATCCWWWANRFSGISALAPSSMLGRALSPGAHGDRAVCSHRRVSW